MVGWGSKEARVVAAESGQEGWIEKGTLEWWKG